MFLHNNRRITALITVICLALLIFCLIERQTRYAVAPDTHLDGLAAGHCPAHRQADPHRAGPAPADPRRPWPARDHPQPSRLQTRLLGLLDVDPTQPP